MYICIYVYVYVYIHISIMYLHTTFVQMYGGFVTCLKWRTTKTLVSLLSMTIFWMILGPRRRKSLTCMSVCLYLPMIIYVSMCICTYACLLARPHVGIVGELGLVVFSPSRVGTYVLHIFRDKEKKHAFQSRSNV